MPRIVLPSFFFHSAVNLSKDPVHRLFNVQTFTPIFHKIYDQFSLQTPPDARRRANDDWLYLSTGLLWMSLSTSIHPVFSPCLPTFLARKSAYAGGSSRLRDPWKPTTRRCDTYSPLGLHGSKLFSSSTLILSLASIARTLLTSRVPSTTLA